LDLKVEDNQDRKRFEARVEGNNVFIDYIRTTSLIYLTHTEVPSELEGQGIGSALVEKVLEQVRNMGLGLAPLCPFVAAYIRKNPKWKSLVDLRYNVG